MLSGHILGSISQKKYLVIIFWKKVTASTTIGRFLRRPEKNRKMKNKKKEAVFRYIDY